MRKQGRKFDDRACLVNPLFSISIEARNRLAAQERKAFDALLAHQATGEDIGVVETLVEVCIRVIPMAKAEPTKELDIEGLDQALHAFYRAAHAVKRAKSRHASAGVYGLDAADREALLMADDLSAQMRQPGVVLRKLWIRAHQEAIKGKGVAIPAMAELEPA